MVDDTRLELAEACRFAPGIRRLFRLSRLKLEFGHKLRVLLPKEKKENLQLNRTVGLWWTIQDSNL